VQDAIYRVLSYQASTGSFGLWGPGSGDLWLDSYVTDFLTRAREQKYDVPDRALVQALDNLQNPELRRQRQGSGQPDRLCALCAGPQQEGRDQRSALLRRHDAQRLPDAARQGPYRRGAGALRRCERSKNIFVDALQMSEQSMVTMGQPVAHDYGSALRDDGAAILALAAESRPVPPIVPELAKAVAKEWERSKYTSTQEQMPGCCWRPARSGRRRGSQDRRQRHAHSGGYAWRG
jgi:uncharacterized protein YfaS (alpha-2-macroglobulin family)